MPETKTFPSVGSTVSFDSLDFSTCNPLLRGALKVELLSQSQESRTSTIRMTLYLYKSGINIDPTTETTFRGSLSVSGPQKTDSTSYATYVPSLGSSQVQVASWSLAVAHNADGTGQASIEVSTTYGTRTPDSDTGTVVFPTISVNSTMTVSPSSSIKIGIDTFSCTIQSPDASWKHKIRLRNSNGSTYQIADLTPGQSSYSAVIPAAAGILLPTSPSEVLYIDCIASTSAGTPLGTYTLTKEFIMPDTLGPTIGTITVSPVDAGGQAITSYPGYIASVTHLKVTYPVSDTTGSTITSTVVSVDGYQYSATVSGNNATILSTTYPVGTSGIVSIKVTAYNARGYSSTSQTSINVTPYSPPNIPVFGASRSDSSGNPAQSSTYIRIDYSYSVTQVSSYNRYSITIDHRIKGTSVWVPDLSLANQSSNWETTSYLVVGGLSADAIYEVRITVTDSLTDNDGKATRVVTVGQDSVIIDLKENGDGIAFGKIAEYSKTVDFGWSVMFSNGISSKVIGSGESLDSYTEVGFYQGSFSNSITSGPSTASGNFGMLVLPAGPDARTQVLTQEITTPPRLYIRTKTNSGQFGPWYILSMTAV